MSKEVMKKTILPMLFLAIWIWIAYNFCASLEQTEWWKIWMVIGMPYGIHRMCVWILPKNFDIGGTAGVWVINIILGCLIGEVVVICLMGQFLIEFSAKKRETGVLSAVQDFTFIIHIKDSER